MAERDLTYFEKSELLGSCIKSLAKTKTLTEYEFEQLINFCYEIANKLERDFTDVAIKGLNLIPPKTEQYIESRKHDTFQFGFNYYGYIEIAEKLKEIQNNKNIVYNPTHSNAEQSIKDLNQDKLLDTKSSNTKLSIQAIDSAMLIKMLNKNDRPLKKKFLTLWVTKFGDLNEVDSDRKRAPIFKKIRDLMPELNHEENTLRLWLSHYWKAKKALSDS